MDYDPRELLRIQLEWLHKILQLKGDDFFIEYRKLSRWLDKYTNQDTQKRE